MNKELNELVGYLDQKFQETAKKEDLGKLNSSLITLEKDVKKLSSLFVTLEEFDQFRQETKQEFADLKGIIQSLAVSQQTS